MIDRWKNLNPNTRGMIIGCALIVLFGVITVAANDTSQSPEGAVAATAPTVAETSPTPEATTTTTTATTTTVPVDEFATWMQSELSTIIGLGDDIENIAPQVEAGDITAAADTSERVGNTYQDLYFSAPETGTALSNAGNDMLRNCAVAYQTAATALRAGDRNGLSYAVELIGGCTQETDDVTMLINQ